MRSRHAGCVCCEQRGETACFDVGTYREGYGCLIRLLGMPAPAIRPAGRKRIPFLRTHSWTRQLAHSDVMRGGRGDGKWVDGFSARLG